MVPPLAVNVTPGPVEHLTGLAGETLIVRGAIELVTLIVPVPRHPVTGFLTITVYTPAAFTIAVDKLFGPTTPGPVQV